MLSAGSRRGGIAIADPQDVPISQLLHNIVHALVDLPEFVIIKTHVTEDGMAFAIEVHPDDRGKLIGRQGFATRSPSAPS